MSGSHEQPNANDAAWHKTNVVFTSSFNSHWLTGCLFKVSIATIITDSYNTHTKQLAKVTMAAYGKSNTNDASSSWNDDSGGAPDGPVLNSQPQSMQYDDDHDWDWDDFYVPNPLFEADLTMRVRTTAPTPLEVQKLQDSAANKTLPEKVVQKVIRNWGKPTVVADAKLLLSCSLNHRAYSKGEACEPGSVAFVLSKCLLASNRHLAPAVQDDKTCYCLPVTFLGGCAHGSPAVHTPNMKWDDCQCTVCAKCLRCGKLLE